VRIILFVILSILYIIFILYYLYNCFIVRKKTQILREIEKTTNMKGAYKEHSTKVSKILWLVFFPLITLLSILAFIIIYKYVR
jgi:hypothetical protein